MTAQVAADLRAAADLLERDGWTQGDYANANGCLCAAGALLMAASGERFARPSQMEKQPWYQISDIYARWTSAKVKAGYFLGRDESIVNYNDECGRTAAEVIAVLRAAADKADQS